MKFKLLLVFNIISVWWKCLVSTINCLWITGKNEIVIKNCCSYIFLFPPVFRRVFPCNFFSKKKFEKCILKCVNYIWFVTGNLPRCLRFKHSYWSKYCSHNYKTNTISHSPLRIYKCNYILLNEKINTYVIFQYHHR